MTTSVIASPPAVSQSGYGNTTGRDLPGSAPYNGTSGSGQPVVGVSGIPRSRGQRQVGDWILGKTIGAGSMGKVKLVVHQHTGEKVSRTL